MNLYCIPLGPLGTNCYILEDKTTHHCFVVDPGGDGDQLVAWLKDKGLVPKGVLLTHGHGDHIGGVQAVIDAFSVPVYIHAGDKEFLTNSDLNLSSAMGLTIQVHGDIRLVKADEFISLGNYRFVVIETPGHTPGGICYYGEGLLLAGDTLFQDSIGRTDFPRSSYEDLIEAIKTKLYTLPDETVVYPGHGPKTTIGHEKLHNPFVR